MRTTIVSTFSMLFVFSFFGFTAQPAHADNFFKKLGHQIARSTARTADDIARDAGHTAVDVWRDRERARLSRQREAQRERYELTRQAQRAHYNQQRQLLYQQRDQRRQLLQQQQDAQRMQFQLQATAQRAEIERKKREQVAWIAAGKYEGYDQPVAQRARANMLAAKSDAEASQANARNTTARVHEYSQQIRLLRLRLQKRREKEAAEAPQVFQGEICSPTRGPAGQNWLNPQPIN